MAVTIILLTLSILGAGYGLVKIYESVINLIEKNRKANKLDLSRQRHGIVINKKTRKVEADRAIMLPY